MFGIIQCSMTNVLWRIAVWITFISSFKDCIGLRLLELRVPPHAVRPHPAKLECHFDLQDETLYSVKWYKDGREFFRYIPSESPALLAFALPGVYVHMGNSSQDVVALHNVTLQSSGRYRCEVSAEAPSFQTVSDHADMVVAALPKEGPRITGGRRRYQVNDNVKINCTSGLSRPHTQLMWFINGEQADPSYISGPTIIPTTTTGEDGETEVLFASQLGLFFRVQPQHFRNGDLKLKCLATISSVYWRSNEESVEAERLDRTKPPVLESREIPQLPPYPGSSYGESHYSNEIGGSGSEAHSGAGRVDSVGYYRLAATRTEAGAAARISHCALSLMLTALVLFTSACVLPNR